MNTQDERKAFESNIAISEMLKDTGIEFSIDKNEYFHSMYSTFVPEDIHFLNGAWWMFQVQYKKLEGCVVVPVEPTETMIEAGNDANECGSWPHEIYAAMVEAARGGNENT